MRNFKESEYEAMIDYITNLKRMLWQHNIRWDKELREANDVFWNCMSDVNERYWNTLERTAKMMREKRKSGNPKYLRGKAKEKYLEEHPDYQ